MPSSYLAYALAALSFGLGVAFFRISDENSELSRVKIAVEMKLETAEGEAKAFREKYSTEAKARETAEKSLEETANAKHFAEAALADAQEQVRMLNAQLMEASAAREQSERKPDAAASGKGDAAAVETKEPAEHGADASPPARARAMAAQASMAGSRPWYSFFGLF